jgi:hypothetical protein
MPRSSTKPIVETFFEKLIQIGAEVSVDVITPHRQSCLTSTSLPTWLILLIRKQTLEAELGSQDSFRWIEPIFPQIHLETVNVVSRFGSNNKPLRCTTRMERTAFKNWGVPCEA